MPITSLEFDTNFNIVAYSNGVEETRISKKTPTFFAHINYCDNTIKSAIIKNMSLKEKIFPANCLILASRKSTKSLSAKLHSFDGEFKNINEDLFIASWLKTFG